MAKIIGNTLNDIRNLTITSGDRNEDEMVVIPGLITIQNQGKDFVELMKIANDSVNALLAHDAFEKQSKMIIAGGYGNGKKLEITHNAVYDTVIRAIGFSYKQLVRDIISELKINVKNHAVEMKEIADLERQLTRKTKRLEDLKEQLRKMTEGKSNYINTEREINEIKSTIDRLDYEIEDARDLMSMSSLSVVIPKNTGKPSERSTISQVAKELKIVVRTSDDVTHYTVTHKEGTKLHPKATGRGGMMTWNINQWLATVPVLTPTKPPSEIVTGCTDSYFRTVINKSPYYCSYRRGLVTIYPACIKDGHVYLGTKPLAPAVGVCSAEYLDMVLIPHGYDHKAVMGWERTVSVSQGGVGV